MKKSVSILSRVLAVLLATTLLLAAVPAVSAAELGNLQVTLRNNEGLPAMTTDQFSVYQLFKGTANNEGDPETNDYNASSWNNYTLADIEWGASVGSNGDALLAALKDIELPADITSPTAWAYTYNNGTETWDNLFKDCLTAADVANVLVGKRNSFMQNFAEWLKQYGESNSDKLKPVTSTGTLNKGATSKDDTLTYDLTEWGQGYYLFSENELLDEYTEYSEFIFAVLGSQDIQLKADLPTVDKYILGGGDTEDTGDDQLLEGDADEIGDTVTFVLTGSLAGNIQDFDKYEYIFHDTLSDGLTYTPGSVKVYIGGPGWGNKEQYEWAEVTPEHLGAPQYTVEENEHSLTVAFEDLKKGLYVSTKDHGHLLLVPGIPSSDWEIIVEYTATLNENAVIGGGDDGSGNMNDVYLEYSNNPNEDGKGTTTHKQVYVYTFGLDLTKVGSDNPAGIPGAGFTLRNMWGKYAQFTDTEDGHKQFTWVEPSEVEPKIDNYNAAKEAYDKGSAEAQNGALGEALQTAKNDLTPYLLESGEDGKLPTIEGLDETITYTLTEVITPAGYNTMDDVTFRIEAIFDEATGKLKSFSVYIPSSNPEPVITYMDDPLDSNDIFSTGLIPYTLVNEKAPFLPFTGGIGTTVLYIAGGALIAGAILYLVISSRKRKAAK